MMELLSGQERAELEELCGRCLFDQLKTLVGYGNGHKVCVPVAWSALSSGACRGCCVMGSVG